MTESTSLMRDLSVAVLVRTGQGCRERGEWLVALDALLSPVVEQWLSSRARETRFPGNSGLSIKPVD